MIPSHFTRLARGCLHNYSQVAKMACCKEIELCTTRGGTVPVSSLLRRHHRTQSTELKCNNWQGLRCVSTNHSLEDDTVQQDAHPTSDEQESQHVLDELYNQVRAKKFEDIVVIKTKFNARPRYLILANAFNFRHLVNGTESINKHFKLYLRQPQQDFAKLSISKEWNVLDFDHVVVHLFSRDCRKHFDIEQLWAVGEKYDDLTNFVRSGVSDPGD